MIFDCFLFNDELDLLELRLDFLNAHVDTFVIAESKRTFSGHPKPLHFADNKDRYGKYLPKIRHIVIPDVSSQTTPWENEFYQRNYIKTALTDCADDDLICIGDVDEIINLGYLLDTYKISEPCSVQINTFYYFLNVLVANHKIFDRTVLSPYKFIKSADIGNRENYRFVSKTLFNDINRNGWHFSYVFGRETDKYVNKIKSFSHTEFSDFYHLNRSRIEYCIENRIDIFERNLELKCIEPATLFTEELLQVVADLKLDKKYFYSCHEDRKQGAPVVWLIFLLRLVYLMYRVVRKFRRSLRRMFSVAFQS